MKTSKIPANFFQILILSLPLCAAESPLPEKVEFNRDVRPILSDNCFYCHGNDPEHRKAKLRLDVREAALKKDAFVPGEPDESDLIERIFSDDEDELMPPPDSHKKLTDQQKQILKRWIAQGGSISNTGRITCRRRLRFLPGKTRWMLW